MWSFSRSHTTKSGMWATDFSRRVSCDRNSAGRNDEIIYISNMNKTLKGAFLQPAVLDARRG